MRQKDQGRRVVITGGGGFVGRHLVAELTAAWPSAPLTVLDRQVEGLPAAVEAHAVDITEPASYEAYLTPPPAWVVHLAAVSSADASRRDPARTHEVNVVATATLLSHLKKQRTKVLAVSTADIYGQGSVQPLPELPLAQAQPQSPYAKSKWEMEEVIEERFADFVIRVRPFPHIGPGQGLGFVTADFASQIAAIEAGRQPPVMGVGNLEAERDFTDVRDVVRAYRLLMTGGVVGQVYHVASGRAVSIRAVLDQLLALSAVAVTVQTDPARLRAGEVPVVVGDARKLKEATGWQPQIPLERTLADVLDWWREKVAHAHST